MRLSEGIWHSYEAPKGTKVSWIPAEWIVPLFQEGPNVKELAVFDAERGSG